MHFSTVDTHAHLCDEVFNDNLEKVVREAQKAGVHAIILVGENLDDGERNLALSEQYPCLKPSAGLYPEYADEKEASGLIDFIRKQRERLFCIGEVGLDFWIAREEYARGLQREVFKQFIELSKELLLPLNVHSRSAGRHAVAMLLENDAVQVQMHAFDGKASSAMPAVEAGYFFSVPPSVVRSRQKQKLVKNLPLSCLLVESDSPVLGPDPALVNEPANIITSLKAIAEIKGVDCEEVQEALLENTRRLYARLLQ